MTATHDLVFAGNLLVDDIVTADGQTRIGEAGGAMLYGSLGAALWGARVALVSVAGSDYPAATLEALTERGIGLGGVRRLAGPGLRTWLLYEPGGRRVVHHLGCPPHADVTPRPDEVQAACATARALHLSPSPFESQRRLVAEVAGRAGLLVSLDPHETVREDNVDGWRDLLQGVDALFVGDDEMRLECQDQDPATALERLAAPRLRFAFWKRGARGGVVLDRVERRLAAWPAAHGPCVDVTGAGDAFSGGVLAGLLAGQPVERALEQGVVSASFAIESWGASGLFNATLEQAERRRAAWFGAGACS